MPELSSQAIEHVVAKASPAMDLSWRQRQTVTTEKANTIADGIAVRNPVPEALQHMKTAVDDIVQVSDDAILEAMKLMHELAGIVVEPTGAVGVAAAMIQRDRPAGQLLATPLCHSNLINAQIE